jgi:hypothetical protein
MKVGTEDTFLIVGKSAKNTCGDTVYFKFKIDLQEIGWEDVDWFHLAQDRDSWWALVNTVINLQVP